MSAYNWIIVEARCPSCHKQVELRCQTHIASDYSGNETGRFHDSEYRLGQVMRWWAKQDRRYEDWRARRQSSPPDESDTESECCYTACPACGTNLYAVIQFHGPSPVKLAAVGLETDWPDGYLK